MLISLGQRPIAAVEQEFPSHDPSHASPGAGAMSLVWRDGKAASRSLSFLPAVVCLPFIERIHP
ncbi:hypothetical protein Q664_34275 [Archangium violaceum Cb vi76]|uniref:Uncharacterized protein n=1 Tax=Archangium violaceum Cb vi76 TaxID=1406225 RepID=A0A084SLW6_9BACT|nr:hypothetical protein Q664_34275 [Archangium violaceum Cb vi76]